MVPCGDIDWTGLVRQKYRFPSNRGCIIQVQFVNMPNHCILAHVLNMEASKMKMKHTFLQLYAYIFNIGQIHCSCWLFYLDRWQSNCHANKVIILLFLFCFTTRDELQTIYKVEFLTFTTLS